jgi:hypothetical protein
LVWMFGMVPKRWAWISRAFSGAGADGAAIFAGALLAKGGSLDGRDGNMDVNPVQEWARDTSGIALCRAWCTGTGPRRVCIIAAGARIHGRYEHKARRILYPKACPSDDNFAFFEGLAKDFQHLAFEFGQLIQEKHAIVGEADFTGKGVVAATHQGYVANGVVGCPKRPAGQQAGVFFEEAGNRIDTGSFEGLFQGEGGQDSGQPLCNHSFAGARRPNHEEVMSAGGSHLHRPLEMKLTFHLPHIYGIILRRLLKKRPSIHEDRLEGLATREKVYGFFEVFRGINGNIFDDAGFAGVSRRHEDGTGLVFSGQDGDRKCPTNRHECTIEG